MHDAERYAKHILKLDLHPWQGRALEDCSVFGLRRRIAIRAPNGAGKDDRIIAPLALWWLHRYRRGQVQITTKDEKQLTNQTWRSICRHKALYPDYTTWRDHDHTIITPTGGLLSGWVTDDPRRAEGYHEEEPDGPLLIIINEAKSVEDEIFDSFNRCGYNLMLEISTGGLMQGRFYEHFTSKRHLYSIHEASLHDCPHISQEKVQQTIEEFGENDPFTRSNIYGEFMATDERIKHVFELTDIESNRSSDIPLLSGPTVAGVDFAAGGDLNTLVKRVGNFCPKDGIHGWRERDTNAALGRFIGKFNQLDLAPKNIWADSDGGGEWMCNDMAAMGWTVNRFHFGAKSPHDRYKNMGSYIWHEVAAKVRKHLIKVPDHQQLIAQLSSRQIKWSNDGKLWMETKEDMRKRGLDSPDYADAFCIAFGVQPVRSVRYDEQEDRFAEISRLNGWEYTPDQEEHSVGRPGRGDGGFVGSGGFGGINSDCH